MEPALPVDPNTWGVDVEPWLLNFHTDLQLEDRCGQGSVSRVYLARYNHTLVAVKRLLNTDVDIESKEQLPLTHPALAALRREARLHASIRHPNVVQLLGVCVAPPCILSEYCSRGSLLSVLKAARQSPRIGAQLTWEIRISMMMDAARGMLALHCARPPITHGNLNTANLLVGKHWEVKVGGLSMATLPGAEVRINQDHPLYVNPRWTAPEVLAGDPPSTRSDVYCFGTVLWEVMTWTLPFLDYPPWKVVKLLTQGGQLPLPARAELPGADTPSFKGLEAYRSLILSCWKPAPEERPSFGQILEQLEALGEVAQPAAQHAKQGPLPISGGYASSSSSDHSASNPRGPDNTHHSQDWRAPPAVATALT